MSYKIIDHGVAQHIAATLMDIKAITINTDKPFIWASGWNSPIYCDNRLTLFYPEIRSFIKNKLIAAIVNNFPTVEVIAGVATAGIPQGVLIAENMNLPFCYVRSQPKGHGLENLIEGMVEPGKKVVVVEDLVSTGNSSLSAVKALLNSGCEVIGMTAIFTYGFKAAEEKFKENNIQLFCLSDYAVMIEEALKKNYIEAEDLELLKSWRVDPANWKGRH
jgi:orotate phosphoribosyltransferase